MDGNVVEPTKVDEVVWDKDGNKGCLFAALATCGVVGMAIYAYLAAPMIINLWFK